MIVVPLLVILIYVSRRCVARCRHQHDVQRRLHEARSPVWRELPHDAAASSVTPLTPMPLGDQQVRTTSEWVKRQQERPDEKLINLALLPTKHLKQSGLLLHQSGKTLNRAATMGLDQVSKKRWRLPTLPGGLAV